VGVSGGPKIPDVDAALLEKYDRPGPRYTSYPTAVEFDQGFTEADYRERLAACNAAGKGAPLSLYVHLPFCEHMCAFCACNVVATRQRRVLERYLQVLEKEAELLAGALPDRRGIAQVHWGGGTPTYLSPDEMERLHRALTRRFPPVEGAEVAIEVDPRVTTREHLRTLRRIGFNRLSMGVQDFTPEVQAAIDRHQTEEETRRLFSQAREEGFVGINMDLVYGLPMQTEETFRRNMAAVLEIRPDRLAIYSCAYVPWIRPHQKRIDPATLPRGPAKWRLFSLAMDALLGAGYRQIGMDHFAAPEDELAAALDQGRLHRNFQGYTTRPASDTVALGITGIGDLQGAYVQNAKKLSRWSEAVEAGRFPVERGFRLSEDDLLRRHVIRRLMCDFEVDTAAVEERFGIEFSSYFAPELQDLGEFREVGFVEVTPGAIRLTRAGSVLVRNVCMVFDRYLREKKADGPVFSRTV